MEVSAGSEALQVRMARSAEDLSAAGRLRYEVYAVEQGKAYPESDDENHVLADELDPQSDIVLIEIDGIAVGTVRSSGFRLDATRSRYADSFALHKLDGMPMHAMVVCSRLAVAPAYRDARIRNLLFETIYMHGLQDGTKLCFASCAPKLLRMFRGYGFREYASPLIDPVAGKLHRTMLVLDDLRHLSACGSPFAEIASRMNVQPIHRAWLEELFQECAVEA